MVCPVVGILASGQTSLAEHGSLAPNPVGASLKTPTFRDPATTPVTGQRIASDLLNKLQINNLSVGPVNSTAVGTAIADQLIALGFPSSAWNILFAWEGAATGNNGNSLTFAVRVLSDEDNLIPQEFYVVALLNSDGTFEDSVYPAAQPQALYNVSNPNYGPFTAANAGSFYSP
jgi:hypothetical protein